ncbi:hypothetical protein, partial [Seonamhaeicola marinus]
GKWKAYSIDLSNYFKADVGAIYRVEISFNKNYSLYDCEENNETANTDEDAYYEDDFYEGDTQNFNDENEELREEKYWDNLLYRYKNY